MVCLHDHSRLLVRKRLICPPALNYWCKKIAGEHVISFTAGAKGVTWCTLLKVYVNELLKYQVKLVGLEVSLPQSVDWALQLQHVTNT